MSKILAILCAAALTNSCASTTMINSSPSGAKLYMNGVLMGRTPYTHSDTKIVGASTHVVLKKKGCQDLNVVMTRDEKFEIGPCIGGFFVLVPFLWIMGYNPNRTYELECGKRNSAESEKDNNMMLREPLKSENNLMCSNFKY